MILRSARSPIAATLVVLGLASLTFAGTSANAGPVARRASLPLAGKVVGIDPGHNGRNYTDPGVGQASVTEHPQVHRAHA